jgi:hypothetical protein
MWAISLLGRMIRFVYFHKMGFIYEIEERERERRPRAASRSGGELARAGATKESDAHFRKALLEREREALVESVIAQNPPFVR